MQMQKMYSWKSGMPQAASEHTYTPRDFIDTHTHAHPYIEYLGTLERIER